MSAKNNSKNGVPATKSTPPLKQSSSPTPIKKGQQKLVKDDKPKADLAATANPSQPVTSQPKTLEGSTKQKTDSSASPPSQLKHNTSNKAQLHEKGLAPTPKAPKQEQAESGKIPTNVEHTDVATPSQLHPKDLQFGNTFTGIMDALGLLDKQEDAIKEYQELLRQQRHLEEQSPAEMKKLWAENNDRVKESGEIGHDKFPGALHSSLLEFKQKHPEKGSGALKEYTFRKSLTENFQKQRPDKHVTQVDVTKPQAEKPAEKKDNRLKQLQNANENRRKAKEDATSTSNESDQADKEEHLSDHGNFRVMIPEGYTIVKSTELEQMQYDLNNQRESIEELTSRLSAIASNKLKEGNPNIADLSDKNRPTKLGEQFAAMYDDQWSEALEEMGKGKEEDDEEDITSIIKLLDVVKESYKFCGAEAGNQLQKIALGMKDAVCLPQTTEEATGTNPKSEQSTKSEENAGTESTQTVQKYEALGQKAGAGGNKTGQNAGATGSKTGQNAGATGSKTGQNAGATGSKTGQNVGATGSKTGQNAGATGSKTGQNAGATGSKTGQNAGATGSKTGQNVGATGSKTGQNAGATGSKTGQNVGATGSKTGQNAGAASGQSGQKSESASGQPGQKSESASGQPGQKSESASGQPGQKSGSANGQSTQKLPARSVGLSESTSGTPPGTPPAGAKQKGGTAAARANTPMSETWQVALRCARSYRKETAVTAVAQIKQLFNTYYIPMLKLGPGATPPDAMMNYIDRCVELMWLMAVQDPPMEIKWVEHGDRSDTNYFKFYQTKGKIVKECVWPAVFLCAQGGIVSKGYIIGMDPPAEKKQQKKTK